MNLVKKLFLFDVDGTLTKARGKVTDQTTRMLKHLRDLNSKGVYVGFVGGSDLAKQQEQLGDSMKHFNYWFPCNGADVYVEGKNCESRDMVDFIGIDKYSEFATKTLRLLAEADCPKRTGNFVELRKPLVNLSPVGRSCSAEIRAWFNEYNREHGVLEKLAGDLRKFCDGMGLHVSVGGQISVDVFPKGWDKRLCLETIEKEGFKTIYFFGDKTDVGGNDHEIYEDARVIGHKVTSPEDTVGQVNRILQELGHSQVE